MIDYYKLMASRILSEANDLKRTQEALAQDLGYEKGRMDRVLKGDCSEDDLKQLVKDMGKRYPIDESDLLLVKNDCTHSVRIMRAADSEDSRRFTYRKNRKGEMKVYYEYRDTAMSKISPYRPEWIRELRVVDNADPDNPDVRYNKGHFLHQYTLFVGTVNYYWEFKGKRYSHEMKTGDSVYGTPWWPHTFTNRDKHQIAYILAVTFGGDVRRAQKELYVLERKAKHYSLEFRQPNRAVIQLIKQHMANQDMTPERLEEMVKGKNDNLDIDQIFRESHTLTDEERKKVAGYLDVEEMDLMLPIYKESDEVLYKSLSEEDGYFYPSESRPAYRIHRMAQTTKMPLMRGATIKVLGDEPDLNCSFFTSLHGWVYNYGKTAVKVKWMEEENVYEEVIHPDDSIYLQPFVRHAFGRIGSEQGVLCNIRVSGAMNLQAQREFSYMSEQDRVIFETGCWF